MAEQEIRYLVRIANTDLEGKKPLLLALRKIKGVSFMFANAICKVSKIDPTTKTGTLSESQIETISKTISSPLKAGIPIWMLNRRFDPETGEDIHLITADLRFTLDQDIKKMMKTKSYKGLRHHWRLPVRGQRTKSNFRRNKGKGLGVSKSKGKK